RHTRSYGDWSSDVCSSDLGTVWAPQFIGFPGVHFVTASLFAFNLRYMLPAVAIGLVTVPLVAERWRRGPYIATLAIGVALASMRSEERRVGKERRAEVGRE